LFTAVTCCAAFALAVGIVWEEPARAQVGDSPGQTSTQTNAAGDASPRFEVASVKRNTAGDPFIRIGGGAPGRYEATNVPLRLLIRNAYRLQDFQIVGAPNWIADERYDIIAKADSSAKPDQMQAMIRALLAERFGLVAHTEQREMPIYALVVARSDGRLGPKLKPSTADCAAIFAARRGGPPPGPPAPPQPGEQMQCGTMIGPGNFNAGYTTMQQFASSLSTFVGRTVIDKTGLTGQYDFMLTYTPEQRAGGPGPTPPPGAPQFAPIDPNGPSLFTAIQEQLGLKLDAQRGPVDVLVIDKIAHPTED
jgi:uncharacterized protein (TIGR03435 family)